MTAVARPLSIAVAVTLAAPLLLVALRESHLGLLLAAGLLVTAAVDWMRP
jgi:lipopolysaccharide export LptBFGC system permease protein LptF